jgi:hypothetical protein
VPVCGLAVAAAVAVEMADSANEKYKSVGLNALALRIPYERTAVFQLDPDAHKYYVELDKTGTLEGKTRFFLASPCVATLKVKKGTTKCAITECELSEYDEEECENSENWPELGADVDTKEKCISKIKELSCGRFVKDSTEYSTMNMVYKINGQQFEISQIDHNETAPGTELAPVDNDGNPIIGVKECPGKSWWDPTEWGPFEDRAFTVDSIEISDIGDVEGFCYKSRSTKDVLEEIGVTIAFIALDIGIGVVTVGTGGVAAPLYFVSGASYVAVEKYLDDTWPER